MEIIIAISDNNEYSDEGFWAKVASFAKVAGKELIEKALWLYYAAQDPATPAWAKGIVYGALGYFVLPIDAIPDIAPVIGYTDDLGVLAAAVVAIPAYITKEVKAKAEQKMKDWFS